MLDNICPVSLESRGFCLNVATGAQWGLPLPLILMMQLAHVSGFLEGLL